MLACHDAQGPHDRRADTQACTSPQVCSAHVACCWRRGVATARAAACGAPCAVSQGLAVMSSLGRVTTGVPGQQRCRCGRAHSPLAGTPSPMRPAVERSAHSRATPGRSAPGGMWSLHPHAGELLSLGSRHARGKRANLGAHKHVPQSGHTAAVRCTQPFPRIWLPAGQPAQCTCSSQGPRQPQSVVLSA